VTGLGIISTDYCIWAAQATAADVAAAPLTTGHPVVKAKPGVVEAAAPLGLLDTLHCWVDGNPYLAGAAVVAGYLLLRRRRK
jgi:MYXO-CTERM domain-containing protein